MTAQVLTGYQWKKLKIERGTSLTWIQNIYEKSFLQDLWNLFTSPVESDNKYKSIGYGLGESIEDSRHHPKINLGF